MTKMVCVMVCAVLGAPAGCGSAVPSQSAPDPAKPIVKPVPPTPIAEKKADLDEQTWNPAWNPIIEKALPLELLSRQRRYAVKDLCPRFGRLSDADRREFWAYFFQALAGAEAGLKPTIVARHTERAVALIDPVTHHEERQEGLLQLSYLDASRYGCDFDWAKDKHLPEHDPARTILRPKNNLLCGMKILDNQLIVRHKPLLSRSSYWVTLRPGTFSYRVFIKQMANEPAFCGWPRVRRRLKKTIPARDFEAKR